MDGSQVVDLATADAFAVGPLKVTPAILEVARGDRRETLEPRIMQVFVALARRRGEVVSRDELIRVCWDGRVVGDDAINRCIARLRRLAQSEGGFVIETIARVGYRLSETEDKASAPAAMQDGSIRSWRRSAVLVAVLVVVIALAALGAGLLRQETPRDLSRVAVLPFEALAKGADLPLFADGLAEQIIDVLSDNQVQAVSRTQTALLRGADRDHAAQTLGADFILDGSIQRLVGPNGKPSLRVTVRLDHATTHTTVWTDSFDQDGNDAVGLQSQVAARVVDEIKAALKAAVTHDDAAISSYLKAQIQARTGGPTATALRRDYMRIVVARAPQFSFAHSGLGIAAAQMTQYAEPSKVAALRQEAQAAIARALELDPKNGEAYIAKALLAPFDYAEQETQLRKGLALQPDEPSLSSALAALMADVGRNDEALALQRRAVMLEPLSPRKTSALAYYMAQTGNMAEARDTIARAAKQWPQDVSVWSIRVFILDEVGNTSQALAALTPEGGAPWRIEPDLYQTLRTYLAAKRDKTPASRAAAIRAINSTIAARHLPSASAVRLLATLGDIDGASAAAVQAFATPTRARGQVRPYTAVLFHPDDRALRRDKRFEALVNQLGLVAYWKAHTPPDFCASENLPLCQSLSKIPGALPG